MDEPTLELAQGELCSQKAKIFDLMKAQGYVGGRVTYEGGNDDGAINSVLVWKKDRLHDPVDITEHSYRKYVVPGDPEPSRTNVQQLAWAMAEPVYDEWHSFAGEYYVTGQYDYDLKKNIMKQGQTVESMQGEYEEKFL